MNILIIDLFGINNSGGTDRVGTMLANSLSNAGHSLVFASIGPCDKPFFHVNKDIRIVPLTKYPRSNLGRLPVSAYDIKNITNTIFRVRNMVLDPVKLIYKIRKLLKDECVDVIIAVDIGCVEFTLPATLGLPTKHICWEHFNFSVSQGKKRFKLRQRAAQYCDAVVTLTERDKEYWLKGTKHKSNIVAIANPCPFPVQQYIKEENTKVVLAVGHLRNVKGFDMLLEAWAQVTEAMPDWILKIVGDGEDRALLTEFIEKNDLADSVELVGVTDNISEYYKEAELFCLSSRHEGFSMVLLEALAFGLPVVSFDCETGPAEILENTGSILVPENNVNNLALSLIKLMKDSKQRKSISLKSKEKAKTYQPEKIIPQWEDLLKSFK